MEPLGDGPINAKMMLNEIDLNIGNVSFRIFIIGEIVRVPKLGSGLPTAKIIGERIAISLVVIFCHNFDVRLNSCLWQKSPVRCEKKVCR